MKLFNGRRNKPFLLSAKPDEISLQKNKVAIPVKGQDEAKRLQIYLDWSNKDGLVDEDRLERGDPYEPYECEYDAENSRVIIQGNMNKLLQELTVANFISLASFRALENKHIASINACSTVHRPLLK